MATTLACGLATAASAEVQVEGSLDSLRVTASGEALADVLSTFGERLPVRIRTAMPLKDEIHGAFSGSLSQVAARLLSGYDYVIKIDREQVEIIVLGPGGKVPVAPKIPVAGNGPGKGIMSRWR